MTTIKQRIRMFAQWATAMGDIPSTDSLKSVAHSNHKAWTITVDNFQSNHGLIVMEVTENKEGQYQIKSKKDQILWSGVPSDTNFNLAMQSSLKQLAYMN